MSCIFFPKSMKYISHVHLQKILWKTFGKESHLKKTLTVTGRTFKVNSYCIFEDADWYSHIPICCKVFKLELFKINLQELTWNLRNAAALQGNMHFYLQWGVWGFSVLPVSVIAVTDEKLSELVTVGLRSLNTLIVMFCFKHAFPGLARCLNPSGLFGLT